MATSFTTFSPSYENIHARMNRLKHHSQNHHSNHLVASSSTPNIVPLHVDTSVTRRYNRKVSPTTVTFNEESTPAPGKFTGRVTKNTGLKKYNQRQIREVMINR